MDALVTKRDDFVRRDKRRHREESALAARREALAEAVAREEERLAAAKAARIASETEVRPFAHPVCFLVEHAGLSSTMVLFRTHNSEPSMLPSFAAVSCRIMSFFAVRASQ